MPKVKTTKHEALLMFHEVKEDVLSTYGDDKEVSLAWGAFVERLHEDGVISDWQRKSWRSLRV